MKKLLLVLFSMLVFTLTSFGQTDLSLGVTGFSLDTKLSSKVGLNIGVSINHFYCDLSSNMASGKGEELDFSSSSTYNANKMSVGVINVGYNIFILPSKIWSITPMIGYGYAREIYEDPIGWDTYFYGDTKSYINFAVITKVYVNNIGIFAGTGVIERFKFGLSYKFN
jgi:hypothetical protein